jgi:site-specific DNA-methyltransferase (adenine-specific)
MNKLFYGDNLDVLRKKLRNQDETVDLCYIDPPFNSKRNYFQIYNNLGAEDRALAQAYTDTWMWDHLAVSGLEEILANEEGRFSAQTVELIKGLRAVLKEGSLLAYLISITLRVVEIHRVLKASGSFYLHCDPTSSHYLKLVLDSIFCSRGGGLFLNEIAWCYKSGGASKRHFSRKHDVLLFYAKSKDYIFNLQKEKSYNRGFKPYRFKNVEEFEDETGWHTLVGMKDYWNIDMVGRTSAERLGYPTQKPEALLERIISASSAEGSVVLDAYCGCGTTVAVAQQMNRQWIGIDITYQSIAVILKRLEDKFGAEIHRSISLDGIPRDVESATALAQKRDDRLRKEFEKWAVLTYTNNRALINEKKGADSGIDGVAFFKTGKTDNAKVIFQVKSGAVQRADVAALRGDMERDQATLAVLIVLANPTRPMIHEAKAAGIYEHQEMGRSYDRISIVTIREIVEAGRRLDIPMSLDVLKAAERASGEAVQLEFPE